MLGCLYYRKYLINLRTSSLIEWCLEREAAVLLNYFCFMVLFGCFPDIFPCVILGLLSTAAILVGLFYYGFMDSGFIHF